jgi:hypothetical protein
MAAQRVQYRLHVNINMEKVYIIDSERGYSGGYQSSGERMSVQEELILPASNFMEVAAVLARFHELAESLKK